jgi:glycosyltransferase involved in cell wall biosynthesis
VSVELPVWHLLTGEYPPVHGGVSAFTAAVAHALAEADREVVVWTPGAGGDDPGGGLLVRRLPDGWRASGLRKADAALDADRRARILFVQWVPHAFGRRSLNLGFCRWARRRARGGDRLVVMIHEPFLPFAGGIRQRTAAAVHRMMLRYLLARAERVWLSIPAWLPRITSYVPAGVPAGWLPVPSSIAVVQRGPFVDALRARFAEADGLLLGHFGTFGRESRGSLDAVVPGVLEALPGARMLLIGRGGLEYAAGLVQRRPVLSGRVRATGVLAPDDLSVHLQACDLLVQPYVDGASARRTTLMAALAHGRAVVTTTGELSEPWWRECGAVEVVPAEDPRRMIDRVVLLAGDRERRQRLESAARAMYQSRFALEHAVARLLAHEQPAG